jgi:hypothetical protein
MVTRDFSEGRAPAVVMGLRLPETLRRELEHQARREGNPPSALARRLIAQGLAAEQQRTGGPDQPRPAA